MKYELLSVIALLLCLLIIGLEYILHYKLAELQDEKVSKTETVEHRLALHVEGVLFAPTDYCRETETKALAAEINGDFEIYELSISAVDRFYHENRKLNVDEKGIMKECIDREVKPVEIYAGMLETGDKYHKGYALRRLADLKAEDYREKMIEYTKDKNRDLSYNAAMALATLGDAEHVADYIISIEDDRNYSGRIVNEFFDDFRGDRAELADKLFENGNPYMKNTVIKALVPYKIDRFRPMYIGGATGNNQGLKISCIKALAAFGYDEDEQLLQMAAKDKDWVIRAAAVRGLSLLSSPSALASVKNALSDKEWWVRQAAASSIINMNISSSDLEDILGGYDRFAADAVKNVLYKKIDSIEH